MPEQKLERTHVALKNGMGTVAAEDYDEKLHGKKLEETDDQYRARIDARFKAAPAGPVYPETTIPNLATFAPAPTPAPAAPVAPPMVSTAHPVVTTEDLKNGSLKPEVEERLKAARPSAVVAGSAAPAPAPEPSGGADKKK